MLNPIEQFVVPWDALDSYRAKLRSAAQSTGFMPCIPGRLRATPEGVGIIHPIALPCSQPGVTKHPGERADPLARSGTIEAVAPRHPQQSMSSNELEEERRGHKITSTGQSGRCPHASRHSSSNVREIETMRHSRHTIDKSAAGRHLDL
ncbi:MAG: hypothetical protein IT537_07430 [Hyphomicrobiales bacterium]|nr:hypothetical protein [Hyphomicrobiales bacterium]